MAKVIVIGNSERIVHFMGQIVTPTLPVEFEDKDGKIKASAEQEPFLDVITSAEAKEKKEEAPVQNSTSAGWVSPPAK